MIRPLDHLDIRDALAQRPDIPPQLPRVLSFFQSLFELTSPSALGLRIVGGTIQPGSWAVETEAVPLSVTGNGWTLGDALVSLLGEAAELLSQYERHGDLSSAATLPTIAGGWIDALAQTATAPLDVVKGVNLATGSAVHLPADIVLRRPHNRTVLQYPGSLSSGVAAGPDNASALLRAQLELIERDAAALWWLGGRQGTEPAAVLAGTCTDLLTRMRQCDTSRITRFIDITTDIGVPVIAACSHDRTGHDMAVGIACRPRLRDAADAALRELGQMELSAAIASIKRQQAGEAGLNAADHRHLQRARFHAADCALLATRGLSTSLDQHEDTVSEAIHISGHPVLAVDLMRPDIAVPVHRALCTGLQPFSQIITTPRFAACLETHGGGQRFHNGTLPF